MELDRTIFEGHVITGNCVSNTVTVKAHVLVLPAASVTLNILVVTPTGNAPPAAMPAVCIVFGLGQLSVPTGVV